MIEIIDLVEGHPEYAFWHGTRAKISGSLKPGIEVVGQAKEVIHSIWEGICADCQCSIDELSSDDVMYYLRDSVDANERAVALGNSIRYLKGEFDYTGVAFCFNKYTARGYSEEGSELANAIVALMECCSQSTPKLFASEKIQYAAARANEITRELLSGPGKVMKLIKIPAHGYFWAPGHPDVRVNNLTRAPFEDWIIYSELFFSEEIPIDHFQIEAV